MQKIYVFDLYYYSDKCEQICCETMRIKASSLNDAWFTVTMEWLRMCAETSRTWNLQAMKYLTEYEI